MIVRINKNVTNSIVAAAKNLTWEPIDIIDPNTKYGNQGAPQVYQVALYTPGNSPFSAFRRNWNWEAKWTWTKGVSVKEYITKHTLERPNSPMMPRPLPDSMHRFFTFVGRVYRSKELSCSCAWWRAWGGRDSFLAIYRYARRIISWSANPRRAFISRRTRMYPPIDDNDHVTWSDFFSSNIAWVPRGLKSGFFKS